jgi:hypothetical protein
MGSSDENGVRALIFRATARAKYYGSDPIFYSAGPADQ